jgi:hypothetical protein
MTHRYRGVFDASQSGRRPFSAAGKRSASISAGTEICAPKLLTLACCFPFCDVFAGKAVELKNRQPPAILFAVVRFGIRPSLGFVCHGKHPANDRGALGLGYSAVSRRVSVMAARQKRRVNSGRFSIFI